MHKNISQLLQQLGVALNESTAVVSGERPPYDEESIPSDISEESDDDTSNEYFPSTELSMRVASITDILNNLYRLSYKIRNSNLRPSSTRANLIQAVDNETGVDLFDVHYDFDSRHLIELFSAMRQERSEAVESLDVLLERLVTSNVLRRKQFRDWERHARKLGVQALPVHQIPIRERPSASEAPEDLERLQPQRLGLLDLPPAEEQSRLSGTNATPYDPALADRTERQTILSMASTALDADGKGIEVPKPPEDALNGDSFTCPYCWVVCPPKEGRGKTWKSHVLHDLRPYVCTYETCNSANDLYQSRKAWVDHEEAMHQPSWRCRDHPDTLYVTGADFKRHLLREHDRVLSGEQLEDLTNVSKLGRVDDRDTCPICFDEQPFPKGLTNHLANHLERIALFPLPRTISNDEKNVDESQFSKLFNIDSDNSSTSEQFEEVEEEEEDEEEEAEDPSGTQWKASNNPSYPPELNELLTMLQYYAMFFIAMKSDLIGISPTLGGHDMFAFELASNDAGRCLLMTKQLVECNLRVHVTAQDGDRLTEILKDMRRFLDTTRRQLDKIHEGNVEDQEKQIAVVTEAMGGLGIVHDILEGMLQVFEGSISLTTGLSKIGEYQSILTTLSPTGVQMLSDSRDTQYMTESIEQPLEVTHGMTESLEDDETLEVLGYDETYEAQEHDEPYEAQGYDETLDPRYQTAPSRMFQPGEVFKTLWPEPAPGIPYTGEGILYRDQYGASILVSFRRFIVVANDRVDSGDSPIMYRFTPFFTSSHVFGTTTGLRALDAEVAMKEKPWVEVGRLSAGHDLYRLGRDGRTYGQVPILDINWRQMPEATEIYGVPLREGRQRYHANDYLVMVNCLEISLQRICSRVATFSQEPQMIQREVVAAKNSLAARMYNAAANKLAGLSHASVCFYLEETPNQDYSQLPYTLAVVTLFDGVISVDGVVCEYGRVHNANIEGGFAIVRTTTQMILDLPIFQYMTYGSEWELQMDTLSAVVTKQELLFKAASFETFQLNTEGPIEYLNDEMMFKSIDMEDKKMVAVDEIMTSEVCTEKVTRSSAPPTDIRLEVKPREFDVVYDEVPVQNDQV
ncbi:heat shock factor (HSF)-type DNA-binding protein [Fusarium pseudocircinatum]|uniref:Heat shock factor (HSF)-type DNA-binding protein n=1 Tax=Fusarium pseudocircinatum TaxID=56676 RepID=A0A8H5KXQ9_9HYPO|nr:heat shock factor (HSF)-type DNA-binding protein [Fusarium pseudocircinatum]